MTFQSLNNNSWELTNYLTNNTVIGRSSENY